MPLKRFCVILTVLLMLLCVASAESENSMTLVAINVRKADCLLLFCGDDVYMIDAGRAETWGQVSATLMHYGIDRLSGVIVTHTDGDHTGGLAALASSSIRVDGWYAPAYYTGVKASKHPVALAAQIRGESVHWLRSGDVLPLGDGTLSVLGPISSSDKENCNSLVLLADCGGTILLTGDMEFPEEEELLSAGLISQCTVLKVANHGESDATSEALIRAVRPSLAVISTNTDDEPDTPAPRVLNLLNKYGAQTVLTQNSGDAVSVTVTGDAASCEKLTWSDKSEPLTGLRISAKDAKLQSVSITNETASDIDLAGYFIYSERGGETFVFPTGAVLKAGATLTVTARGSKTLGDYVWPEKNVWAKNKDDEAVLYDAWGNEIDRLD